MVISRTHLPTLTECSSLVQSYTRTRSLLPAKKLHALLLTSGHLLSAPAAAAASYRLPSLLASLYSLSGHLIHARHLFDEIPHKTPFLFNTLIRGHVLSGLPLDALLLFSRMLSSSLRPDNFSYPFALKACANLSLLRVGVQIHCSALSSGYASNDVVQNALIFMYMNCSAKEDGVMVFDEMPSRNIVSWNTVIAGCVQNGCSEDAVRFFNGMMNDGVEADQVTFVSVLPACAQLKDLERGRLVHEMVEEMGLGVVTPVRNSLVDMYVKCGRLEDARRVFDDGTWERDVISWTAMIGGYAQNGFPREAFALSHRMLPSGIKPNPVTMVSLLSGCADLPYLNHGKCIHGSCIRLELDLDIVVETALIDMYAKCGGMDSGLLVFARGSRRTATWNVVIASYIRNGQVEEAMEHFKLMLRKGGIPDLATIASLLPAYGESANLLQTENLHCYLIRTGFFRSIEATTSLIDAYAKVGCLDTARELFDGLAAKDTVSWSAIIAVYGNHGNARTAIELFNQMVDSGMEPNNVTYTTLLSSCSRAGLVDDGLYIFDRMLKSSHLEPDVDHYACIVDLLSRAGRLEEARRLTTAMPFEPNRVVWGAFLGGCVVHENVELGEMAAKRLFELEPENPGNYVLLGNIYASVGRREDAEAMRRMLDDRGLMKVPGCSSLEARVI